MLQRESPLKGMWQWIKGQIIREIPKDIDMCEFDCRKGRCTIGEWETCDRRLSKADGELKPATDDTDKEHLRYGSFDS